MVQNLLFCLPMSSRKKNLQVSTFKDLERAVGEDGGMGGGGRNIYS